jgi:hypothetical protein
MSSPAPTPPKLDVRTLGVVCALICSILAIGGQVSQVWVYAHRVAVLEEEVRGLRSKSDAQSSALSRVEAMVADIRDQIRDVGRNRSHSGSF